MTIESVVGDLPEGATHEIFMFPQCRGGCPPPSWEPWVWRAGGLLVIAIIWGHVPGCCFTPCWAHQHGQIQVGQG